ncbi:MAG: DUF45 domain-containing protein, partial [Myxococcales bacterium]|nr:DUF45 domain-containing protein [Myxococcales bacterium]
MHEQENSEDESRVVQWGHTRIDYAVRRSNRRKTVAVAVDPIEGVLLTAPAGVPGERLDGIVRDKARWITARLRLQDQAELPAPPREFVGGESYLYLGRQHRLRITVGASAEASVSASVPVKLDHGRFIVTVPAALTPVDNDAVRRALESWYRSQATRRLQQRVALWAPQVGVEPTAVLIRDQAKRWASCDAQGQLRFNWRII